MKSTTKLIVLPLVLAISIIMGGCSAWKKASVAPTDGKGNYFQVDISSFGDYDLCDKTYYIESGDENISSNDVEFKEYAEYLKKDLKIHGARETTDKDNADLCILMNYCITDESYQETVPVPEYGRTSIRSSTTKGNTTTYSYNYGVTGYHYEQNNVSKFVRVVNIYAYDNKTLDSEPVILWKTNLKSEGSSNNLREVIPHILCGCCFYIGKSGQGVVSVVNEGHLFNSWKQGLLTNPDFYLISKGVSIKNFVKKYWSKEHKIVYNLAEKGEHKDIPGRKYFLFSVEYVEKKNVETVVCLSKTNVANQNQPDIFTISPNLYLKSGSKEVKISYVDNYVLGSPFRDMNDVKDYCFIMHFPINLQDAKSFEIVEYTNKNHTKWKSWGTFELEKTPTGCE